MEVGEVLRKAADYIDEHGWAQGHWDCETGCVCADGAIIQVAGEEHSSQATTAFDVASDVAKMRSSGTCYSIISWNDQPGRTKEEVTRLLRDAAQWYTNNKEKYSNA